MSQLMTRRGDIRNSDYAWKAKQYSWGKISQLFPRGISPTDIDGAFEMNGKFLAVEFKTEGTSMPRGQALFFERWLERLRANGFILICEHPQLESVAVENDITYISAWWWDTVACGVAKLHSARANDDRLVWFMEQWRDYADGRPNDLIRCCREKIGIYPPSAKNPFLKVGGSVYSPPFVVSQPEKRIKVFSDS